MKAFFFTLFFSLTFTSLWAQSVTGNVVDAKTGRSLPGCSVRVGNRGTITNEDGKFSLSLPGVVLVKADLLVSSIGYKTRTIRYGIRDGWD